MDVQLAARLRKLVASGCSIRSAARELGVSRSAAMRVMSAPAPVLALADEYDGEADPWADDDEDGDDGLPVALLADDAAEPHEVLSPPFDFEALVDVPDNLPTRRRDGKIRQAPQWRDAHGLSVAEVDLWRWGLRLDDIIPANYDTREEYLAAWDAADNEIEAVKAHAWESLHAAGVYHDDDRRRWVQRARAV